jgi:hypothetical protein
VVILGDGQLSEGIKRIIQDLDNMTNSHSLDGKGVIITIFRLVGLEGFKSMIHQRGGLIRIQRSGWI